MTHRAPARRRTLAESDIRRSLIEVALLALGAGTALITVPTTVRVVGFVALVLIPGAALVRLLLAEHEGPSPSEPLNGPPRADSAIRLPLTVIFGAAVLLGAAMSLDAAGVSLSTRSVGMAAAGLGVALTLVGLACAARREPGPRSALLPTSSAADGERTRSVLRTAAAVTLAATVISCGIAGAIALQPKMSAAYTTLTFMDQSWLSEHDQVVAPAGIVRINWQMRAFGYIPDPQMTGVTVRVDNVAIPDVALDIRPVATGSQPGQPTELYGSAAFPAPLQPGRHLVEIIVQPFTHDTLMEREPVMLTGLLKVSPT